MFNLNNFFYKKCKITLNHTFIDHFKRILTRIYFDLVGTNFQFKNSWTALSKSFWNVFLIKFRIKYILKNFLILKYYICTGIPRFLYPGLIYKKKVYFSCYLGYSLLYHKQKKKC